MNEHQFYSARTGAGKFAQGFDLETFNELFFKVYQQFRSDGFFDENFGFYCVDDGNIEGHIKDIELDILLKIRKKDLWPIETYYRLYTEDDLFDVIEYLYFYVSKPIKGSMHSYGNCGMHWEKFDKPQGQKIFLNKINELLKLYEKKFELSVKGEILSLPEKGFENIFKAELPSNDNDIKSRYETAIYKFRHHGATFADRRHAVRDLADILEKIRPEIQSKLTNKDDAELFNIANNFAIRHLNDRQKSSYDQNIWLSWMFYIYLSTIHAALRLNEKIK